MLTLMFAIRTLLLVSGQSADQTIDDWDLAVDSARQLTVATVAYAEGSTLFAACLNDTLTVGLKGLPTSSVASRRFERRFDDGHTESTFWEASDKGTGLISATPARVARSFRNGSRLVLSSAPDGEVPIHLAFDVPTQSANLDRVLAACGRPLENPLDSAPPLDMLLQQTPAIPPAASARYSSYQVELDCIVADGRLSACLSEHQRPADPALGVAVAREANGVRVKVSDPTAAEGRWVQILVSGSQNRY
ncbi:hypothetical protein ACFPIF_04015 [Brevundimonas faecalis]|uniref:hypothetical protein n=1 Tax=Brevundimonas faecalis TaxID=947378 RepID=UPI003609CED0